MTINDYFDLVAIETLLSLLVWVAIAVPLGVAGLVMAIRERRARDERMRQVLRGDDDDDDPRAFGWRS